MFSSTPDHKPNDKEAEHFLDRHLDPPDDLYDREEDEEDDGWSHPTAEDCRPDENDDIHIGEEP